MIDKKILLAQVQDQFNDILENKFDDLLLKKLERMITGKIDTFIMDLTVKFLDKELLAIVKAKVMENKDDILKRATEAIEGIILREIKYISETLKQGHRIYRHK